MPEPKRPLKVFLSYASQDRSAVRELSQRLAAEGWIDPWLDIKKLLPGQDWRLHIEEAVETSDIVIICLSTHSVTKEGYIQKELRYAREIALEKPEETIFLIPLRLDECDVPRGLRFYQWVDYFGEKKDEAYNALIESLKLRCDQKLRIEEAERARREKEDREREAAEKAAREKAEKEAAEKKEETPKPKKVRTKRKWDSKNISILVALIALILVSIFGLPPLLKPSENTPEPTLTPTVEVVKEPSPTETMKVIEEPEPTLTEVVTPTETTLPTEITDNFGVEMVFVPAGGFTIGSDTGDEFERPMHIVNLPDYYIDKFEVTNALFKLCVDDGVCTLPVVLGNYANPEYSQHPVIYVDLDMAITFCAWRGARLPTEIEWEKAARGTDGRSFPWGEEIDCSYANYSDCVRDTTPVGSYEKGRSVYGLYDMTGNAWELTLMSCNIDYPYNSEYPYTSSDDLSCRMLRGGAWNSPSYYSRTSMRYIPGGNIRSDLRTGFRCVRDVNP